MKFPEETELNKKLQEEFEAEFRRVLDEAYEVYKQRGVLYDMVSPVWSRVPFPEGFVHEMKKKLGRIEAEMARGADDAQILKAIEAEAVDIVNYAAFCMAIARMLRHRMEAKKA